jgi:APA family basic amino acid/polyamine antiporter
MTNAARTLGIWTCAALVAGNMIGSGIFLLPASLAPYGSLSLVGWLLSAGGTILIALTFSRLARRFPRTGGPYVFAHEGFGDFTGFLVAWGYWISILATNAAVAVALVSYLTVFWPALAGNPLVAAGVALAFIWTLTFVNCAGVRQGGRLQVATTVLKLLPLLLMATVGLFFIETQHFSAPEPEATPEGSTFGALQATIALTMWAFLGVESATIPADNVREPARTIPRATMLATLIVAAVYIASTVAVMGILPQAELAESTAPFAEAGRAVFGDWAAVLMAVGAAVSCLGALNGWILLQGQIPLASARDGLFPTFFGRTSANGTPVVGILISSVLVTVLMLTNYSKNLVDLFTFIILLATLSALVPYVFSAMAEFFFVLRERREKPAGAASAAAVAFGAFLYSMWAIAGSGHETVYWGFLLLLAGLPVYIAVKVR